MIFRAKRGGRSGSNADALGADRILEARYPPAVRRADFKPKPVDLRRFERLKQGFVPRDTASQE